jgi:hypothetical protein
MLVLALQTLSPALWLRRDALTLRHAPLHGQPLVEVVLSRDLSAVLGWLGLGGDKMREWEEGFEGYEDVYRWITDVRTGNNIEEWNGKGDRSRARDEDKEAPVLKGAWETVREYGLEGMRVDWKRFHTRVDGLEDFIKWLRQQPASVSGMALTDAGPSDEEECPSEDDKLSASSLKHIPPLPIPIAPSTDPEHPTRLDAAATAALAHFSETHTYERHLRARQEEALAIVARQRRRAENKEREAQRKREVEARRARETENGTVDGAGSTVGTSSPESLAAAAAAAVPTAEP